MKAFSILLALIPAVLSVAVSPAGRSDVRPPPFDPCRPECKKSYNICMGNDRSIEHIGHCHGEVCAFFNNDCPGCKYCAASHKTRDVDVDVDVAVSCPKGAKRCDGTGLFIQKCNGAKWLYIERCPSDCCGVIPGGDPMCMCLRPPFGQ